MSTTNSTMDTYQDMKKPSATGFVVLIFLSLLVAAVALYKGNFPLFDVHIEDWIDQARVSRTWSGVAALGGVLFLVGLIGTVNRLFAAPVAKVAPVETKSRTRPELPDARVEAIAVNVVDSHVVETKTTDSRGSLKFDAHSVGANTAVSSSASVVNLVTPIATGSAVIAAEPPMIEIQSLEPAIFSDNASDSFLSQNPAVATVSQPLNETQEHSFDSSDALLDTHGLHIGKTAAANSVSANAVSANVVNESAQVIQLRPDTSANVAPSTVQVLEAPVVEALKVHDPVEAALLAETPDVPATSAPQSDMNAVISSAMRFISSPEPAITSEPAAVAAVPEIIQPVVIDDEAEIRQAVQTALSVWPDATRTIAADELSGRIAHLYYDKAAESHRVFQLIASGDLSAAANALQSHADTLAVAGAHAQAAELWRVYGALHLGRDDAKAMSAYEHVSELDPADANIHLYLARRYALSGDTAKQPVVIARALNVVSDPATRTELLAPFADLKLKAGDVKVAGDAFEELSRLHETAAYLKPDDVAARSAHAITVARLAQTREMQGAFDQAGPLYKKAAQVFSDLSAMKPEHPGLRAMADNAARDAQRFNMA